MASRTTNDIETTNPYAGHAECSDLEAEVLWEYAKLAKAIRRVDALARDTADNPNDKLLEDLRVLEKKMGLVLTLFKASVWALITDQEAAEEQRKMEEDRKQRELDERDQNSRNESSRTSGYTGDESF
ncbi:DASH complex subunit Dad3-domain-containing protein [Filobasidium floriforme]|uniref:DASH complex subunit Dad3-domain-containing protein n=1 Tax=Filobasidium floriforme TaxID=5210 RepID=UPI001E8E7565|nr:DASH complex subunit Dad3-domain-containing protein [Filobasidium floriforme]KAH8084654.1 DASH complex subunit Dad3-domain-containing protein [Filobasidium floriforme]